MPAAKPKLDSAVYKVSHPAAPSASAAHSGLSIGRTRSCSVLGTRTSCPLGPAPWERNPAKLSPDKGVPRSGSPPSGLLHADELQGWLSGGKGHC